MEFHMFKVLLSHAEHITRVGKEHIAAVTVLCHILILALLESLKLGRVVALYPTSLVEMDGLPTTLGVVLVLKTILYNLKLELTNGTDNLATVKLVNKQLGHTLVHELVDALLKLFRLHGVIVLDILEHLWRERWQATEMELLTISQRVADLEDAVVGQTHNVARIGLVNGTLALRHKLCGGTKANGLVKTHMEVGVVTLKASAAHLAEGDT